MNGLLDAVQYLYRDIKGRRENLAPLFAIGGNYSRKNPFFENRVSISKNNINVATPLEIMDADEDIKSSTVAGVISEIFDNDKEIKDKLGAVTVAEAFRQLKEKVDTYYGESN